MQVKTFKTERGARMFKARIHLTHPGHILRVSTEWGWDFRPRYRVEVYVESAGPEGAWIGVGSFKRARGVRI